MWRHPKYYKELRKRNKSDQAISSESGTPPNERATGPGLKLELRQKSSSVNQQDLQASSAKHQASRSNKRQASSFKAFEPTCSIAKRQASQSE